MRPSRGMGDINPSKMPGGKKKASKKPMKKMAGGGLAGGHKSADGVARKGKTKAKQIKMAYGGKC